MIIDATFGAGGYSEAFLKAGASVIAFDRDPQAIAAGKALLEKFPGKLQLINAPFSKMQEELQARRIEKVDAIAFDLGVSSMQLDQPERGFSFRRDGPLDMRMGNNEVSAAELINTLSEKELADIFYNYGEEKKSRSIAKAIVTRRQEKPFTRTLELAELVARIVRPNPKDKSHPATRTFQALRIAVNRELDELAAGVEASAGLLKPGGRLAVVTFHSLEDRLVKQFLAGISAPSRHMPQMPETKPSFKKVNARPIVPQDKELAANPRARSAKLRIGEKI